MCTPKIAMEHPALFQRQEFPSLKQQFESFHGRMVPIVAGDSGITTGNVLSPSKPRTSRLGLRLFSGKRIGNNQSHRNLPCGRRPRSSTRSLIDPNISSTRTIRPFAATNTPPTRRERIEMRRTQRNQSRNLNSFLPLSETRATSGAPP